MALSRAVRAYYLRFLAKPMILLLYASMILHSAGIFEVFWPGAAFFGLLGMSIAITAGLFLCVVNRTPVTALWALMIIGFFALQNFVFSVHSGARMNLNALIGYLPLVSFVLIRQRVVSIHFLMRSLAFFTVLYLATYVFLYDYLVHLTPAENPALLVGDDIRGARLRLVLELASFIVFYATLARRMNILYRLLALGLGIAALWLSGSRTFQALFVLVYLLAMFKLLGVGARTFLFMLFCGVGATILSGMFIAWNPMALFSGDNSGLARATEYGYAIQALQRHWFTGVGLWNDFGTFQEYLRTPKYNPLFPSDLGILGPYIVLGLPGLLIYILATWFCIVPRLRHLSTPGLRALRLNCVLCGTYGIISPAIFLESQTFFLAMLIGLALRTRAPIRGLGRRLYLM
ncbi:hypothetical protein [Sphingobium aquiterrae]|uniref:hypothetical protein n=1 Tax=Sphingobium aquiterrae TaxID=2038656 RepID=UPI0030178767